MEIAFVLLNINSRMTSSDEEALASISKVPGVSYVEPLLGEYDAIAKIEAEDHNSIGQIVVEGIRAIPGDGETKTLTAYRLKQPEEL